MFPEWRRDMHKTAMQRVKWGIFIPKFHSGISMTTMLLPLLFRFYVCGI